MATSFDPVGTPPPWLADGAASIVFGQTFEVPQILHGSEDLQNLLQKRRIHRFADPIGPTANIGGIGASGDGGRDVGVGHAELEGQLGDVGSVGRANAGRLTGRRLDVFRFLQPMGQRSVGQEARAEGTGIHDADPLGLQIGHRLVREASILERVLVVTQDAVDVGLVGDESEDLLRIAAEADESDLAGFLGATKGRERFVDNLLHGDELDIVAKHDVEVIGAQTVQTDIDAFGDAFGGEIKMGEVVASEFGAEDVLIAGNIAERETKQDLAHAAAVEGGGVDEVESGVQGDPDALEGFFQGNLAELLTEGAGAEAKDGDLKTGATEGAERNRGWHGEMRRTAEPGGKGIFAAWSGPKIRLFSHLDLAHPAGQRMSDLFDLRGEVAVVIGATGVLGGAIAEGLAQAGAAVAVLGRNADRGGERVRAIEAAGGRAAFFAADAQSRESLVAARSSIAGTLGEPTILVNAAGGNDPKVTVTPERPFEQIALEDWRANFDLNLVGGVVLPCQVFGPAMVSRGKGSIINVASASARLPLSRVVAYSASKAAVLNLTRFLAREWAGSGVRVNAITPGFFPAEQNRKLLFNADGTPTPRAQSILGHTPMKRFGEAPELVGAAVFLASSKASGFVTGTDVVVDGGFLAQTI